MKLLLTSGGVSNQSIRDALTDLRQGDDIDEPIGACVVGDVSDAVGVRHVPDKAVAIRLRARHSRTRASAISIASAA